MKYFWHTILLFSAFSLQAQQVDTLFVQVRLSQKQSTAPAYYETIRVDTMAGSGGPSLAGLLQKSATLDFKGAGPSGGFGDLSIRGGSFNQLGVMINGIPVGNPQTGHHLVQLPLDPSALRYAKIIDGSIGFSGYGNTFAGALYLATNNTGTSDLLAEGGQYGLLHTALNLRGEKANSNFLFSQALTRSGGYLTQDDVNNTDMLSYGQFAVYKMRSGKTRLLLQGGWQIKNFGANRLYSPYFPWQYERLRNGHAGLLLSYTGRWGVGLMLSANGMKDRFELFREDRYTYRNGYYIHQTDTAAYAPGAYYRGANIHLSGDFSGALYVKGRIDYAGKDLMDVRVKYMRRAQMIYGNKLGTTGRDSVYLPSERLWLNRSAVRMTDMWTLGLRELFWRNVQVDAAFSMLRYGKMLYPAGGFVLKTRIPGTRLQALLRSGSGFRLPTFTEMYYQGPTNRGNPGLEPERNWEVETGLSGNQGKFHWQVSAFYRYETAPIDWIRFPGESHWHAENICSGAMTGLRARAYKSFPNPWLRRAEISYQFLNSLRRVPPFHSKYALDYLRHHAILRITQQPADRLYLTWTADFKSRQGEYAVLSGGNLVFKPYNPFVMFHLDAGYRMNRQWRFFLRAYNLNNVRAYDLAFVPLAGRWISAGFRLSFE